LHSGRQAALTWVPVVATRASPSTLSQLVSYPAPSLSARCLQVGHSRATQAASERKQLLRAAGAASGLHRCTPQCPLPAPLLAAVAAAAADERQLDMLHTRSNALAPQVGVSRLKPD
jgi:hypothetical protein